MLRITAKNEGKKTKVLYLEGKICHEWVRELHGEISRGIREGDKIILDFSRVSYLDEQAAEMINRLPQKNVKMRNESLFIRTLLHMEGRKEK